ncbi:hypothetical protein [Nocardia thailandica]|uniref:hypothetical protein n=1 Tax=Nocardia thailandica TaxID=257275 RepID=UPI000693FA0F
MRVDERNRQAHVSLAAAGDDVSSTFAICGAEGRALWYGPYLDNDVDHPRGSRHAAAMGAAGRAIWLAARAMRDVGAARATLHLSVSEPALDVVTLACTASMSGIALDLQVTQDNPALDWCQAFGRLDWNPGSLPGLIEDDELPELPALRSIAGGRTAPTKEGSAMFTDPYATTDDTDPGRELRAALESLLLHDSVGMDARMRHAVAAVVHLAVDTPHGLPEDAEEFLGRLDAAWLIAAWLGHDTELSLIATLSAGEEPALSWCELMFTTSLAPWSSSPVAVHARRIFAAPSRPAPIRALG